MSNWINVDDKIPEIDQYVLTDCWSIAIFKGVLNNHPNFKDGTLDWERDYYDPFGDLIGNVTHWMPLPEPPK